MQKRLMDDHERLRRYASALEALLVPEVPAANAALVEARWDLSREILRHLTLDERHVLMPLMRHQNAGIAATAKRFKSELDGLYQNFQNHMDRYDGTWAHGVWNAYCVAARKMIGPLIDRLEQEEAELYPLMAMAAMAAEPAASRNWAGDAWPLRERICRS